MRGASARTITTPSIASETRRVVGYAWAVLVIIQSFLILSYAPWYGFAAMLLAILVILALSSTSDYREGAA